MNLNADFLLRGQNRAGWPNKKPGKRPSGPRVSGAADEDAGKEGDDITRNYTK